MTAMDDMFEKTDALLELPYCTLVEMLSKLGILDEETEKEYRAKHEAAHSLLFILAGENLKKAEIHFLRSRTCANISRLLGSTERFCAGETSIDEARAKDFVKKKEYENAIVHMAGFANTINDYKQFFEERLKAGLLRGDRNEWTDISVPCKYITERFLSVRGVEPPNQKVRRIFYVLLDRVHEIFQEEKFAKALEKIAELIKKRQLKKNINARIKTELEAIGLSAADLQEMSERIYSIDIDQIIREYESSRPPSL